MGHGSYDRTLSFCIATPSLKNKRKGVATPQFYTRQGVSLNMDITLNLSLKCSTTGECSNAQLLLRSLPDLGIDLKKEIEDAHNIPAFAQTLTYGWDQKSTISDDDSLSNALLRNGDTVWITYTAKAEFCDIGRAVGFLKRLTESLSAELPAVNDSGSSSALLLRHMFSDGIVQLLRKVMLYSFI